MSHIRSLGLLVLLITFIACNKEEEQTKAINIEISGYNVGDAELETSVDTTIFRAFTTPPDKIVNFSKVYTFPSSQKEASLKVTDKTTGKAVFHQQLSLSGSELELFFPFVYINGNVLNIEQPAADTTTNKLAFYIHYPGSEEAFDIFLRNDQGQMVYIAQNVHQGAWIKTSYMARDGFKEKNKTYWLCFVKAGTTDSWYFEESEWFSSIGESSLIFPKNEEKGLVRTYFVTPGGNQLDVVRLFRRPK